MANVLNDLAADIYKSADVVSRELVGVIPGVTINGGSEGAALNDTVRSHFTRSSTAVNVTGAMAIPEGTDQTVDSKTLSITKSRGVQIPWTGEDILHVNNGSGFETIYGDQIAQAMRTLTNEAENDLWTTIYQSASRAYGTAATTPFASTLVDTANIGKILKDNGAPQDSRASLVIDTVAGVNLRTLATLNAANEAGSDTMLRQGILLPLHDLLIRESAKVSTHTQGTGSGYLVNSASLAIGDTVIPADTGAGTVLAGDIVTFAGDTNKYVVTTALSAGSFTIAEPGLLAAPADNAAITVGGTYTGNIAFHQTAVELAIRPPAMPALNGISLDAAIDEMTVIDDRSGLAFAIRVYAGHHKAMIEVSAAWGYKVWKPEHTAILLG